MFESRLPLDETTDPETMADPCRTTPPSVPGACVCWAETVVIGGHTSAQTNVRQTTGFMLVLRARLETRERKPLRRIPSQRPSLTAGSSDFDKSSVAVGIHFDPLDRSLWT